MQNGSIDHSTQTATERVAINPRKISWVLGGLAILMALVSLLCQYLTYIQHQDLSRIIPLVDVDTELSLPSIYSVFLLFLDTALLALITFSKRREKAAFLGAWVVLTLGFLFLTFDEGASIHENLMTPVHNELGDDIPSYFYFTWVVPALVAVAVLGVLFFNFLRNLPGKARTGFLLSAMVYLGGALGMELVGGNYASQNGLDNLGFNLLSTIEESMEMLGAVLFIRTLLTYIADTFHSVHLRFRP